MLGFIRHKIMNKKWLNFCLLTGVVLLSAFLCVYPMFKEGSLNRMIKTLIAESEERYNAHPGVLETGSEFRQESFNDVDAGLAFLDTYEDVWTKYINIPVVAKHQSFELAPGYLEDGFTRKGRQFYFAYVDGFEEHTELKYGVMPKDAGESENEIVKEALENGAYPCVVSEKLADNENLCIGQKLKATKNEDSGKKYIDAVIVGIVSEKDEYDDFWIKRLDAYDKDLFFEKDDFSYLMSVFGNPNVFFYEGILLNHTYIDANNAPKFLAYIGQFKKLDTNFKSGLESILASYSESEKTISVILFTFELPIVALLLLFIYMISGQIIEMETGEIAMLKSRGVSRLKVIGLYSIQSLFISGVGCVIGSIFGIFFCKLGASTDAFLVFSFKDTSVYKPNPTMLLFMLLAFALSMLFMTIPVIGFSKFTIIERRSAKTKLTNKAFWEKFFLDIPIVLLAAYLLYNYSKQKDSIALSVLEGGKIDPIIFINSSIFILGLGLFSLRLIHLLVKLIYKIGKNKWRPDEYVAFLQIIRSSKRQGFISVFLVMTIAMGIFNSNLARSVNENMEQRIEYNLGCDYVVAEKWPLQIKKTSAADSGFWKYTEPDFQRYDALKSVGVESIARVIRDASVDVTVKNTTLSKCTLLGINTKEFGQTARLKKGLNEENWFNYLNALAQKPNGVIISRNLATKFNLEIGSRFSYARMSPATKKPYANADAVVVAIVDAFPGYETYKYENNPDAGLIQSENYLVVANYAYVVNTFNVRPYEVWMRLSKRTNPDKVKAEIEKMNIVATKNVSSEELIQEQRNSTLIQITNGMFSVGFVISLTVCAVGFLIYWILTIKERELIYGIYRSMGLTMKEVLRMLIVEQIFSSLIACVAGLGVGMLTTHLFTKLISIVYLPKLHNIPISVIFRMTDIFKMAFIVALVFVVVFTVIYRIIKGMNITKAIKLGED